MVTHHEIPANHQVANTSAEAADNARCKRGIALFKQHATRIRCIAPWTYRVPSQGNADKGNPGAGIYLVYIKPGEEACSCPDYARYHETDEHGEEKFFCKHYVAARLWKARSAECAGCKSRLLRRDMTEAGEDHLTFYADDYLCPECVRKHGLGMAA